MSILNYFFIGVGFTFIVDLLLGMEGIKNHPKMVYVSHVNPHEIKGPHLHTKRDSYFVCIRGNNT